MKEKKGTVVILFFIIVVLLVIVGILLYNQNNNTSNNNVVNNEIKDKENLLNENKENNNYVEEKKENVTTNKDNENVTVNTTQNAYNKISRENWSSKQCGKFQVLNNEIYFTTKDNEMQKINFKNGTPKSLVAFGGNEMLGFVVLTEEKEAYTVKFNGGVNFFDKCDESKFIITKVDLGEKIIDCTEGKDDNDKKNGPYYLTESGKILTINKISYDDINK